MALYRLYYLTSEGRLIRRDSVDADDHEQAIAAVGVRPEGGARIELWLAGELVKRWPSDDD